MAENSESIKLIGGAWFAVLPLLVDFPHGIYSIRKPSYLLQQQLIQEQLNRTEQTISTTVIKMRDLDQYTIIKKFPRIFDQSTRYTLYLCNNILKFS
jgi:nitrate reductase assembly molybdenum cofactor insertion protein NarJ